MRRPPPDIVEVWSARIDGVPDPTAAACLSADESDRAERFHFPADRDAFVAGRAWLRTVLAAYAGRAPGAIRFSYGRDGKPALVDEGDLAFNLAHSGGLAVLAVTRGRAVGIDVEAVRPVRERVAERFFAPAEIAALSRLPAAAWLGGFYDAWTRKEAYLKALGSGLAAPLDGFAVSLGPGEPARLLAVRDDPEAPARWQMAALDLGPGYAGALAASPPGWTLRPRTGENAP